MSLHEMLEEIKVIKLKLQTVTPGSIEQSELAMALVILQDMAIAEMVGRKEAA